MTDISNDVFRYFMKDTPEYNYLTKVIERQASYLDKNNLPVEDIRASGWLAAWQAACNYDESIGARFITYATECVSGHLKKEWRKAHNLAFDHVANMNRITDTNEERMEMLKVVGQECGDIEDAIDCIYRGVKLNKVICNLSDEDSAIINMRMEDKSMENVVSDLGLKLSTRWYLKKEKKIYSKIKSQMLQ